MDKVTAGRDVLGEFAPTFARLNDDVLFGEVWSREEELPLRDRSIVTVTALIASGVLDSSLKGTSSGPGPTGGSPGRRWLRCSPMPPSTPAGRRPGPRSDWPRRCTPTDGPGAAGPGTSPPTRSAGRMRA